MDMNSQKHSYLRDWIYGGIDGAVSTFAIVSGVVGGKLSAMVIIILGFASLVADGFSMAASNYLGTASEHEEFKRANVTTKMHINEQPELEKQKIREILIHHQFEAGQLDKMVTLITDNKNLWLNILLYEEYGLPKAIRSPLRAASNTFLAFLLCGMVPLAPYLLPISHHYAWSCSMTGVVFFLIGSIKSKWTLEKWWYSGSVTLLIGGFTALIAYGIGYGLERLLSF